MRITQVKTSIVLVALACAEFACSAPTQSVNDAVIASSSATGTSGSAIRPLETLNEGAARRISVQARVPLVAETSTLFKGIDNLAADHGRVPNYVRAVAILPDVAGPFARLFTSFIYEGTVAPEVKMAMGVRVAQINNSVYTAAHMQRLLRASERGQSILNHLKAGTLKSLAESDRIALNYAESLTKDIYAVNDSDFQDVRRHYDDSQIVELTLIVSFFNYFTRFSEALHLPLESWVLDSTPARVPGLYQPPPARVTLLSDEEITAVSKKVAPALTAQSHGAKTSGSVGFPFPNSDRAMYRVPALALAWHAFNAAVGRFTSIGRDIKLQVSFAVSMANGCRYCTLHQVVGMRRLGVDPAKLLAMAKDDEVLAPRERVAVNFARKLTNTPGEMTDADYQLLRDTFGEQGALEVLEQTCHFAFLNRFTDGLRLPSEDEAIRVYREVYGGDWETQSSGVDPSGTDAALLSVSSDLRRAEATSSSGPTALLNDFTVLGTTGGYLGRDDFLGFIRAAESGVPEKGWFEGRGWLVILLIVLVGGLALNLTPCVLPMIPINLAIIGAGAQAGSRRRGFLLGSAYGAAIAVVYGIVGVVVILTAGTFGTINASPWFNLAIAGVFVILALAMFDVITIDLSRFLTRVRADGKSRGTFLVAFGMGAVAALLAGACVAPVVIQVVLFSSNLYATGTTAALALPFVLGFGMAVPWPFAGAGLSALPKPGAWMVHVKQALGLVILGTGIYYGYLGYTLLADRWVDGAQVTASAEEKFKEGWYASLSDGLAAAQREQKPVLIDFWATWCKNCLTMDKTTLVDPAVTDALKGYVKVKFQAEDPGEARVQQVMQRFGAIGLPTYVVLRPGI